MSLNDLAPERLDTDILTIEGIILGTEIVVAAPPAPLWFGLSIRVVPLPLRHNAQTRQLTGLRVTRVSSNSPAARAGLRVDDVLLSLDGVTATFRDALADALRHRRRGDVVQVSYLRRAAGAQARIVLCPRDDG